MPSKELLNVLDDKRPQQDINKGFQSPLSLVLSCGHPILYKHNKLSLLSFSFSGCNTKVDVTFLLDSSDNVGKDNFQKQLAFVKDSVSKMNIAPDKVQASVVTYSTGVDNQFYLNQYRNKSDVQNAIARIPYKGGSTHTSEAIRFATGTSFSPLHGGRSDASHVAIVVTNGPSGAIDLTKLEAQTARDNGVILYSVGVGSGVDMNELKAIASDPDSRHLFTAQNYDALHSLSDLLATKVCNGM